MSDESTRAPREPTHCLHTWCRHPPLIVWWGNMKLISAWCRRHHIMELKRLEDDVPTAS